MQYNRERLTGWANKAGEEMREDFNNPDVTAIEVVRLEDDLKSDPPEVCVYWQAKLQDGSYYPTEAYFSVEISDILEEDDEDFFNNFATSKIFAHLAPELKKAR
jgi:hypothetical protein